MIEKIKTFNKAINTFLNETTKTQKVKYKKIFFLRNEQIENFTYKINNYSSLSNLYFKFYFSNYDNNLSIIKKKYDISIIWLDYTFFKMQRNFFEWINSKANEMCSISDYVLIKPIILPNIKYKKTIRLNNEYKKIFKNKKIIFLDIIDELLENEKIFWDLERADYFGTKTSFYGQDLQAKLLGLKVLPSLYRQKIKSIIFDLDDTLINGAIGEESVKNIYLDSNQRSAEKIYSSLKKKGTLLSICSKNNIIDVEKFFRKKILKKKLFFPIRANWKTKSENIKNIQKILKISFHNILFIDNNISEIIEVKRRIPEINVFWSQNSLSLLNCLKYYPNLTDYFSLDHKEINNKRIADLKASLKREKLIKSHKNKNYLAILKMKIEFRLNNISEFDRIFSLVNKVNQFIFTYKRFSRSQVHEYFKNPNKFIFTVALKDKFSDSGNVCVIFFSKNNNTIFLDEICISCRALGRKLESCFIFEALKILLKKIKFNKVLIKFVKGPKNEPAKIYFDELHKKIFKNKKFNNKIEIPCSKINKFDSSYNSIRVNFKN